MTREWAAFDFEVPFSGETVINIQSKQANSLLCLFKKDIIIAAGILPTGNVDG